MQGYADLFVVPVPKANMEAYRRVAETFLKVWREHGALSCAEIEGDDVPVGSVTSFPRSVALKDDESVFVGVITYRDRAHRDEVNAKAMADPRLSGTGPASMPFDGKRMFFGGFKPFLGSLSGSAVQPYLFFRGRCAEAMAYYQENLGAEVLMQMRFKDNPEPPPDDHTPVEFQDRIMHAVLRIRGTAIMMSDGVRSGALDFQCMSLSLSVATEADADRIFAALAADGTVQMPLGRTFFAPRFGAVTDKFGVSWMVVVQ